MLSVLREALVRHMVIPTDLVFDNTQWTTVVASREFAKVMEPEPSHERILAGRMGTVMGMSMWSDAYTHPAEKFVRHGEVLMVGIGPGQKEHAVVLDLHTYENVKGSLHEAFKSEDWREATKDHRG
jgi:uncharacterized protein (DUF1697 family)